MRTAFLFFIYKFLMRGFLSVLVGVKYVNKDVLKTSKQFIIVSNHNSHIDSMALMASLPTAHLQNTHPIAAGDYFGNSPFKAYITKLFTNAVLIPRKSQEGKNPIRMMSEFLVKGQSLILFPEGSRGEPEKMQEFKKGIGLILKMHPDIPFIPVYMKGMGKILPKGERLLVPFDSYVVFGEPSLCKAKDTDDIVKEIESAILDLSSIINRK